MTIFKTIYSASAILASNGGIPGRLMDGVAENFAVTTCTADTVVIEGTESSQLEPGHILVNLGDGSDVTPYCTPCAPLFRKVETLTTLDGNAYTTTSFATFSEVFPEGVYDESLANTPVEPLFKCEHSHSERKLNDNGGANADFIFCQLAIFVYIASFCFGLLIPPLAAVLWPFLILLGNTSQVCGLNNFVTVYEFFFPNLIGDAEVNDDEAQDTVYPPEEAWSLTSPDPDSCRKLAETAFPSSCEEFIAKDNTSGKCAFVDCDVGADGSGADCFNKEVETSGLCRSPDMIDITGMFELSNEACCMQEHCYSSNLEKDLCDYKIHKTITANCPSTQGATVVFPLETSVLSQNCHMLAALFYLGTRVFGKNSFDTAQTKQADYNNGPICNPANDMQF